jgi:hypothetical protein
VAIAEEGVDIAEEEVRITCKKTSPNFGQRTTVDNSELHPKFGAVLYFEF